jgi:hypothetical protein
MKLSIIEPYVKKIENIKDKEIDEATKEDQSYKDF